MQRHRSLVGTLFMVTVFAAIGCGGTPKLEQGSEESTTTGGAAGTAALVGGGPGYFSSGGASTGGASTGGTLATSSYCGDGTVGSGETCDDGNLANGDGCSSTCQTEPTAVCPPAGGSCRICGNGSPEVGEGCDDGNTKSSDGCSSTCQLEAGWVCDVPGKSCHSCGNGTREGNEACDDGNLNDGDGCSADCKTVAVGYNCPVTGGVCSLCGDGVRNADEACDDGNRYSLDGCLFNCKAMEEGYTCPQNGGACQKCGDHRVTGTEQCDDGNTQAGDGCSSTCMEEAGHICVVQGFSSYCYECGNGKQEGSTTAARFEQCDDSNTLDADGCSATCQIEANADWVCPVPGQPCLACGNGRVEGTSEDLVREECDDGNKLSGDGCSATCQLEPGARCPQTGGTCVLCGNGIVSVTEGEQCDDGNRLDRDGCSSTCQQEAGWTCPTPNPTTGAGGPCNLCGNGRFEVGTAEQCDDGNTRSGDGCSACTIEPGWECQVLPGTVRSTCDTCGNGVRRLNEECDDGKQCADGRTRCNADADCVAFGMSGPCQARDGDGCSTSCKLEGPYTCPEPGGILCHLCGNGVREGTEICDAGQYNGYGCINDCLGLEAGWSCPFAGQPCERCGDGHKDVHEACDDGDQDDSNGCSANCQTIRPGWVCSGADGAGCTQCGNSRLDTGEECDDGSPVANGDGCSGCVEEPGWDCFPIKDTDPLSRSVCDRCGNGVKRGSEEACDDGNATEGDGCNTTCQIEPGWMCPETGGSCRNCGDGKLQPGEVCDLGPSSGGGCAECTAILPDWYCSAAGSACAKCGDGVVTAPEICDDSMAGEHPVSGDGCRADCRQVEEGWICPPTGGACSRCGNRALDVADGEACDDGNRNNLDGCSSSCQIEPGSQCYTAGVPCESCGNKLVEAHETCEDGNGNDSTDPATTDGCAACQKQDGWSCPIPGVACNKCGDGLLQGAEQCDDENATPRDGCTACVVDPGWSCSTNVGASVCTSLRCGDGHVAGNEQCDDGNTTGGDGCSVRCLIESGYICPTTGGACRLTVCGDSELGGSEQCDDGNLANLDGCSSTCKWEPGWHCTGEPGSYTCTTDTCGNGIVGTAEHCDDGLHCEDGTVCTSNPALCTGIGAGTCAARNTGCDSTTCTWKLGYYCSGTVGNYTCVTDSCGNGVLGNAEACDDDNKLDGDGCASSTATCSVESLYKCSGAVGTKSNCKPIFEWVAVREFRATSIDPDGIHYDPNTRAFVGYKSSPSQNILELCLDGSVVEHPIKVVGKICQPPAPDGSIACADYAAPQWPLASGIRNYPTGYGGLTGATYDPKSNTWFFLDASNLIRVSSLPRYTYNVANYPPATPAMAQLNVPLTGALALATAVAIGDDGRLYLTFLNGVVRAFKRSTDATKDPMGFDFVDDINDPTDTPQTWNFVVTSNVGSLFPLAGFSAMATLVDGTDAETTFTDLVALDTTKTGTAAQTKFGESSIPGALFRKTGLIGGAYWTSDVFGRAVGGTQPSYRDGDTYHAFARPGAGAESTTDGSGFIVCTASNNENCILFAQICETDADCVSGATCQKTYVEGGVIKNYVVPFCSSVGMARDDFSKTTKDQPVLIEVLSNDTRGSGTCRESSFDLLCVSDAAGECKPVYTAFSSGPGCTTDQDCASGTCQEHFGVRHCAPPGTVPGMLQTTTLLGGTATILAGSACANGQRCVDYTPPAGGVCNIIDSFRYLAALGGGEFGEATVKVTVACTCGNGVVDTAQGEQCDGEPNCSATCTWLALCGDGVVQSGETCDDGKHCADGTTKCTTDANCASAGGTCQTRSGDGCAWDCRLEGCGNGIVDGNELCDPGVSGSTCRADCTWMKCNDGILDPGEQCDDGNQVETDGCLKTCVPGPICGNGVVEGIEQCDGGSTPDITQCRADCKRPFCGDGILDPQRGEECDDGDNENATGACSWNCLKQECGNARLDYGELCDDGKHCGDGRTSCRTNADCATAGGDCVTRSGDGCSTTCNLEGCGNSTKEGTEQCDDGPTGSATCRANCTLRQCGDALIDPGEGCDDGNNKDADGCSSLCQAEGFCGNGVVDGNEACDYLLTPSTCNYMCQVIECGNGYIEAGEECDDKKNGNDSDGCRDNCTVPRCGDKVLDSFRGEQCDDGSANGSTPTSCTQFCVLPAYCGNGRIDANEQCDNGPDVPGDGCSALCQFEGCGNGVLDIGEVCDPTAPVTSAPACRSDCTVPACGDGLVDPGEQCDDHNLNPGDGCSSTCTLETICGDGRRENPEQCDDGNHANGDGCSSTCRWEFCGNGVRDLNASGAYNEECDDGNNVSGDGCSSVCTDEPICGDRAVEAPEKCDDGNTLPGDGCSPMCQLEAFCGNGIVEAGEECDYNAPGEKDCTNNCTRPIIILL